MSEEILETNGVTDDPWVEDWTSEESPEPKGPSWLIIPQPDEGVSASAISQYDDIGESATADTISEYLSTKSASRSMFMTVLHNSASPASADQGLATVKSFARYHMNTNHWKAIGYHFVIDTKGTIWAGRKVSMIGAHAGSNGNPGSIGVCLVGNFETLDEATEAQKRALAKLHIALHERFYRTSQFRIRFHREFMNTACPGRITQDEVMGWVSNYGRTPSEPSKILLNGQTIGHGILIDGTMHGPLRSIFEAAGFGVDWIGAPKFVANLTSPGKQPTTSESNTGTSKKPKIVLDGSPIADGVVLEATTYVPIRTTFEKAGFYVEWVDGSVKIISPSV